MNGRAALEAFLRVDPADSGCDEAVRLLHVYAELAERDPAEAERWRPDVAAHLRACGPCREDLAGLLAAIRTVG
jgi:hypothetical protein